MDIVHNCSYLAGQGTGHGTAPKTAPVAAAERPLLSSWQRVPSKSRPGEFSYMHVPTGLKQARFPESEPSSDEIAAHFAATRKRGAAATGGQSKKARETRPLMKNESTAQWHSYLKSSKGGA